MKLLNGKYVIVLSLVNGAQFIFEEVGDPKKKHEEIVEIMRDPQGILVIDEVSSNGLVGNGASDVPIHQAFAAKIIAVCTVTTRDKFEQMQQRARLMQGAMPPGAQGARQ